MVFFATVDCEDAEGAGTDETGFGWLARTGREDSTAGFTGREDSWAPLGEKAWRWRSKSERKSKSGKEKRPRWSGSSVLVREHGSWRNRGKNNRWGCLRGSSRKISLAGTDDPRQSFSSKTTRWRSQGPGMIWWWKRNGWQVSGFSLTPSCQG